MQKEVLHISARAKKLTFFSNARSYSQILASMSNLCANQNKGGQIRIMQIHST